MAFDLSTPSAPQPVILVVDDDADVRQAAGLLLGRNGFIVREAAGADAARARLAEDGADLVLLDLNLRRGETSGEEGLALLGEILALDPQAAVVVVTAHSGVAVAVKAMRAGAADFVTKPWSNARLLATLEAALANRRRREDAADGAVDAAMLIGDGAAVVRARELIRRVAPSEAAVFVTGDAGTGKSLIATLIHRASPRAAGPFVAVDLSALGPEEAETALFGDPRRERPGALAEAKGGVLVLDEVGALPAPAQARLLAALQSRAVAAGPGGTRLPVDVRSISLSRRPPAALGGFNHDLLHRLSTVELAAPGLGGGADTALLAEHFLRLFAQRHGRRERPLSPEAAAWLAAAPWADAVRGLRHALERAVLLAQGPTLALEDLAPPSLDAPAVARPRLADSEKALLTAALKRHGFNVSRAAGDLGLTRQALYRRMARHGL